MTVPDYTCKNVVPGKPAGASANWRKRMLVIDKEKCIGAGYVLPFARLVQFQKQMTANIISTPMNVWSAIPA